MFSTEKKGIKNQISNGIKINRNYEEKKLSEGKMNFDLLYRRQ